MVLPGRLPPAAMFPAGDGRFRVHYLRTRSGVQVRIVEAGAEGGEPVFLIPGWACSAWVYRHTLATLAAGGYRAITCDLVGHGLSEKPDDPAVYTTDALVTHVAEILDALRLDRAVIGGHSMGAGLAANLALRDPARFTGVILLSPVGMTGFSGIGVMRFLTPRFLRPFLPRLQPRWWYAALLWFVYGKRGRATSRDVDEYWAPTQFPQFAKIIRDILHAHDWGVRHPLRIGELRLPVFYARGTRDRLLWKSRAEHDSALLPNATVHWIRDAGHTIAEETPEEVGAALLDFLRRPTTNR